MCNIYKIVIYILTEKKGGPVITCNMCNICKIDVNILTEKKET